MKKLLCAAILATTCTFATTAVAEGDEEHIDLVAGYLDISEQFVALASRKESAIFFAVEGIVEIHEARGEEGQAIPILTGFLEQYPDNQTVRNIIRFKLRDLYQETGQTDRALAELSTLIEENK